MRRQLLYPLAAVLGALAVGTNGHRLETTPTDARLDPDVELLLRESTTTDGEPNPRFLAALSTLAARHGVSEAEYRPEPWVDEGRVTQLAADGNFAVVLLRGRTPFIPGEDTQHVLLLNNHGRVLDRVSCEVNNRLTGKGPDDGFLSVEVLGTPAPDGAQLVVRFTPARGEVVSGNWQHQVTHHGRTACYHWEPASLDWERQGLCRVAIREKRFAVVFPRP